MLDETGRELKSFLKSHLNATRPKKHYTIEQSRDKGLGTRLIWPRGYHLNNPGHPEPVLLFSATNSWTLLAHTAHNFTNFLLFFVLIRETWPEPERRVRG